MPKVLFASKILWKLRRPRNGFKQTAKPSLSKYHSCKRATAQYWPWFNYIPPYIYIYIHTHSNPHTYVHTYIQKVSRYILKLGVLSLQMCVWVRMFISNPRSLDSNPKSCNLELGCGCLSGFAVGVLSAFF